MGYVTTSEADTYVQSHYLVSDQAHVVWSTLDNTSKDVLLTRSFEKLERLAFTGYKALPDQLNQFPRYGQLAVPQAIKTAQIIEALHLSGAFPGYESQQDMRIRGVKSYTIGKLSETFINPGSGIHGNPSDAMCAEAMSLLLPYMSGGYRVC